MTKTVTADAGVQVPLLEAFTFQLKDASGTVVDEARIVAVNGRGDYPGALKASVEEPGTYTLTVSEVDEAATGWSYDDAVYTVGVSVANGADDKLSATVTGITKNGAAADDVVFTNTYASAPEESEKPTAKTTIPVTKVVTTKDGSPAPAGEIFTFELENDATGEVKTATVSNIYGNGSYDGGFAMTYTEGGIYNYTLTEKKGDAAGWTYDESSYHVMVVVPKNANGPTGAAYVTISKGSDTFNTATFTNTYASNPEEPETPTATATIPVTKVVAGENGISAPKGEI